MTIRTFRKVFGYNNSVRIVRPARRSRQDLRDIPLYSIPEAASYLAMSPRTLTSWFSGTQRLFDPAGDYRNYSLLSFKDVAQAYVLYILKHFHKYTPAQIERAMREIRKETKSRHPLLTLDRRTAAKNLMLNKPPRGSCGHEVVNLSKFRNLVLTEVVDACSQRILKNSSGETLDLFPWRFFEEDGDSRPVSMDPSILSGRLVVTGTRIPVSTLLGLKLTQHKTVEQIAKNYDLNVEVVKKALRHIENPLQKVA